MTVIDILTRVDAICQKYDKYDVDKLNGANVAGDDPFARLYASVDADINQCVDVRSRPLALRQRPGALDLNLTTVCLAFGTESGNGEAREEPGRGGGA
jgi:syntaxin of plants SYP7|uniref:Uncharacterized protein n=1 Tax=Zea mays TaxID=4577 RepID=B4FUY9_MAIZE|nr:unknown [Zea mays]